MKFIIIGIPDTSDILLPSEIVSLIGKGVVFSGGRRHHELVRHLLPEYYTWIDITVPLSDVFNAYRQAEGDIVIFASGDPLFFGFANTLQREMPEVEQRVFPYFNALQTLAHRMLMPYHDMRIVSLTGRPWKDFDTSLIERCHKIGVLTDRRNTPRVIAQHMIDYGYTYYNMTVGENLGNASEERITTLTLQEASEKDFATLNCVILQACDTVPPRQFGIADKFFAILEGRPKMITKMPIRLLSLQSLELPSRHSLWDVGFCTGSVSIEARLQFPHLDINAFEIRPEGKELMQMNTHRFGAPGIETHIGDFLAADITSLPKPDAVFIGGHGGHLYEIIGKINEVLLPGGVVVMNSVTESSRNAFISAAEHYGLHLEEPVRIVLDDNNPITIMKLRK